MHSQGKCLHTEIADIVRNLQLGENAETTELFLKKFPNLKIITTNYDELIEKKLLAGVESTSYASGYPINRQPKGIQIYHIHGSVKYPKKMVVTADDYFKFMNNPDYFSKKVQTLIEENTVIIIGYSLGDVNFKTILNKLRANRVHDINRQHLFFLSRKKIDRNIKDYYDKSYGLRVIDETEINSCLNHISTKHEEIKDRVSQSRDLLMPVLNGNKKFTDTYLKKRESFFEIMATLSSNGILISHPEVMTFIEDVLRRKREFSEENGAWDQYVHLAVWLIQLGAIMDIKETSLEKVFIEAVDRSFDNMSKKLKIGYSWHAFGAWKNGWTHLTYDNREMIINHFKDNPISTDGREVITQ